MSGKSLRCILFLLALCFGKSHCETCVKLDECSCQKSNGKVINLRDLDSTTGEARFRGIIEKTVPKYTLDWNPCTRFSLGSGCTDMLMCQKDIEYGSTYPCAKSVNHFEVHSDGSVTIHYDLFTDDLSYERTVNILLKCDENQFPGTLAEVTEENPKNLVSIYSTTLTSRCACDDGCVETGGGLSAGSILLIVFIPLFFVYLIGGMLYNKYRKGVTDLPEMIPNHAFWADIPFLVKDGCVFTFEGLRSCCRRLCNKAKGNYREI